MKKTLVSLMLLLVCGGVSMAQSRPTREVKMPQEHGLGVSTTDYTQLTHGFFCVAQASTAYTVDSSHNLGFTAIEAIGGYRFNDYLRVGVGLGARYYYGELGVRNMSHDWGMPLFLDLRGNFIPNGYRDVVPYWSMDIGTTLPDGVMVRPAIGLRIGQPRSAFLVSLGYIGQDIRVYPGAKKFRSGINLSVGYEF